MTDEELKNYLELVAIRILQVPALVTVEEALYELEVAVDYLKKHQAYTHRKPVLRVLQGGSRDKKQTKGKSDRKSG